jgi:hypothetical protein
MPINHFTPKPLQVAAAVIGNALEWCDFIIFGFLTVEQFAKVGDGIKG